MDLNTSQDMEKIMELFGPKDPETKKKLELISSFLNQQKQISDSQAEKRAQRNKLVRQKLNELKEHYAILADRNDALAAALGACPDCWGDDPVCINCQGQGFPGGAAPDEELFNAYVLPLLETLGLVESEVKTVNSQPENNGGSNGHTN